MLNAVSSLLQTSQIPVSPASAPAAKPAAPAAKKDKDVLGSDTFRNYSRMAGMAAGGGFAAYKLSGKVADNYKELTLALKPDANNLAAATPALQKIIGSSMHGAGLSAMVAAGVSALTNGISVVRGQSDAKTAVNQVFSDTITGAVGGFGAVSIGGAGHMLLGSFGIAGLPLTIGTVAIGAAGGVLAGRLGQKLQDAQKAAEVEMAAQAAANSKKS